MDKSFSDFTNGLTTGELMKKEEPLDPELKKYLSSEDGFSIIKHPLVISFPHVDELNALTNAKFKFMKYKIDSLKRTRDWGGYVFSHERPFRLEAMIEVLALEKKGDRDPGLLSRMVKDVWIDSEFPNKNKELWRDLWRAVDVEHLDCKPIEEGVAIYRGTGVIDKGDGGVSWTLDYEKAFDFAKRDVYQNPKGFVLKTSFNREAFIGAFNQRGESEVIALDPVKDYEVLDEFDL